MKKTRLLLAALLVTSLINIIWASEVPALNSILIIGSDTQDAISGRGLIGAIASRLPSPFDPLGRKLLQRRTTGPPEPIMQWLVDKHNELRYRHGAAPMAWDWNLAWNAYDFVMYCPNGHSGAQGIGENLAWGHNDFNHAMRDWYDEIQFYNFNQPGFAENTGHFSQLVWDSSVKIGCAANLRCRFRTWICQFTPAGNIVNYGGSVDVSLWTQKVKAPGAQWVTGTKADGTPSYASYDPTGETTRGLPAPQYGELKNFGYVPKPGQSVVMHDWQKYVPTGVLQSFLPKAVLAKYLDADTMSMLEPTTKGVNQVDRTIVGWQSQIPAEVVKKYVPINVLQKYVPSGVVLATTTGNSGNTTTTTATTSQPTGQPSTDTLTAAPGTAEPAAAAVQKPAGLLGGLLGDLSSNSGYPAAQAVQPTAAPVAYVPVTTAQGTTAYVAADQLHPAATAYAAGVPYGQAAPAAYVPVQQAASQQTYPVPAQQYVATQQQYAPTGQMYAAAAYAQQPTYLPQQTVYVPQPAAVARPSAGVSTYTVPGGFSNIPVTQRQQQQQQLPSSVVASSDASSFGQSDQITPAPTNQPVTGPATPTLAGQTAAAASPSGLSSDLAEVLDRHNLYRRKHQSSPLVWDDQLALQAADFARSCPMGSAGKAGLGENIAWGYLDPAAAVDTWYSTIKQYNFAAPAYSAAAGQFTQLVWASAQKLGCAVAPGCSMPTVACFYYPAGNVINEDWSAEVKPATAAVPKPVAANMQPDYEAVDKRVLPVDVPKAFWARVGTPITSDGAPISLTAPAQPAAAALLSDELQAALNKHNMYRALHQAPALQWDTSIASTAQAWAAGCPNGHSGTAGVGENMAWGYASLSDAVDAWYNEVKLYDFNKPGWSTATGHFTQVVWKSTVKLGCAVNSACSWPTYVCQYSPPGNIIGVDWSAQVLPISSTPVNPGTPSTPSPAPPRVPPQPSPAHPPPSSPNSPAPVTPNPPVSSRKMSTDQKLSLTRHNKYRGQHGVPALTWDTTLAAQAQTYANSCPSGHSGTAGVGENMAWGYSDFGAVVDAWYNEVSNYDYSVATYQPGSGHFTQVIWRSTTRLGCAVSTKCSWKTFVCQYKAPGNVIGKGSSRNVLRPVGMLLQPVSTTAAEQPYYAAAVPKPEVTGTTATAAAVLKPEYQAALDRTNMYRQRHQAVALVWDDSVAATAAQWAAGCPMGHSGTPGVGENMAWGYPSLTAAVDAWYQEVNLYDFTRPGWNSAAGHFTALVWTDTTKLGCAQNTACSWPTYVCQYKAPGNVIGLDWSQKVKRAITVNPNSPPVTPAPSPRITSPSPPPRPVTKTSPSPKPLASPSPKPLAPKPPASPSPRPVASPSPKPVVVQPPPPVTPSTWEMQQVLNLNNAYRRYHQAPPLAWDEKLVASAKAWASTCQWAVSNTPGVGEAIGFGYATFNDAVTDWYNQVNKYDFNNPGWSSSTGLFTQMVWRDTTAVGCYANPSCQWAMYVCHYSPRGNLVGPAIDWSKEVMPPLAAAVMKPGHDGNQLYTPADAKHVQQIGSRGSAFQHGHRHGSDTTSDAGSTATAGSGMPTDPQLLDALNQTNKYRSKHQVSPLMWDAELAAQAALFAEGCPLSHSHTRGVGENLAWGHRSFSDAVDAWYSELTSYNFDAPGWSPSTGHFTQLVWKSTIKVGCAYTTGCTWSTYVCQYSPPGNVIGTAWSDQVKDSTTSDDTAAPDNSTWSTPLPPSEPHQQGDGSSDITPAPRDDSFLSGDDGSSATDSRDPNAPPEIPAGQNPSTPSQQNPEQLPPGTGADGTSTTPPAGMNQPPPGHNPNWPWVVDNNPQPGAGDNLVIPPVGPIFDVVLPRASDYRGPYIPPDASTGSDGSSNPVTVIPQPQMQDTPSTPTLGQNPATNSPQVPTTPATPVTPANPTPQDPTTPTTPDTSTPPPPAPVLLGAELQEALDKTNNYRQLHQAPALQWDPALAAQAAAYIANCPRGHSGASGVGENLAWGYSRLSDAVDAWYSEVKSYDFARGGFSSATGHFSQLVWRDSSKVGCAANRECAWATYICQYAAAGNVMGVDWSKEVLPANTPATTSTPAGTQSPSSTPQNPSTTTQPAPSDPSVPADFADVLAATNSYRAKHQVAPLKWDAAIAAQAQQYAAGCPAGHSGDKGVGENLAWGYPSWRAAVDGWYNEVSQYDFNNPGWSSATGHFTQLVWKDTTKMGCGVNTSCGMATYVCQYAAAGNVIGVDWSQEVLPAKA